MKDLPSSGGHASTFALYKSHKKFLQSIGFRTHASNIQGLFRQGSEDIIQSLTLGHFDFYFVVVA